MRETSSPGLTECLDAAAGGSRPQVLAGLWEAMPADMRLDRFALVTVPERHRDAFFRGRNAEIGLSGLPGPMKQGTRAARPGAHRAGRSRPGLAGQHR